MIIADIPYLIKDKLSMNIIMNTILPLKCRFSYNQHFSIKMKKNSFLLGNMLNILFHIDFCLFHLYLFELQNIISKQSILSDKGSLFTINSISLSTVLKNDRKNLKPIL